MLVILLGLAFAVSLPTLVLGCECFLALLPLRRERRADRGSRPTLAVLVPAHNEQAGIAATIDAILPQLEADDRLIVIADNCSDQTASVALDLGATVLERFDDQRRGKGYAIRFALDHLAATPPEVVVSIDADCLPLPGCIERIARAAYATGKPIQAAYLMLPPENASAGTLISAFAVLIKNYVRPRGLQRFKLPCLITGSGVAYPWQVLAQVPHPESHIVEDMHYSVDLALAGVAPQPCMEAFVESKLPGVQHAARTQRTRWEHGHLSVMLSQGPRLLAGAIEQRSPRLFAMWLELMVPPLSLLLFVLAIVGGVTLVFGLLTAGWPAFWLLSASGFVCFAGLTAVWWRFGQRTLPPQMLIKVPQYILSKLSIYTKFLSSPEQSWVPTARDPETSSADQSRSGPHFDTEPPTVKKTSPAD